MIKNFFVESWLAKLLSLVIATAIWFMIKSHLDRDNPTFPVPGTGTPPPARTSTVPGLEETMLAPLTTPVPGDNSGN
ncbi:MAG: hypothetical protein CMO47_12405 [Verrucomicrobiales bacterium]|jgi:hypothetical protein|nr:hypothetical protein [Verrucomicrobiales bacterium]|tara:strand:- start:174 stop:404 length:231 start_codon:yes stop_codon:yes gene_type:complete